MNFENKNGTTGGIYKNEDCGSVVAEFKKDLQRFLPF
jgi:hypothetical protein